MAISSPRVSAEIVEATEFPALARRYNVYAVPMTVINEMSEVVGAVPESEFAAAVVGAVGGAGEGSAAGESTPLG